MQRIESAIESYYLNTGQYPAKLDDLLNCPKGFEGLWQGPYLESIQLYDIWDYPYIYELNSTDPNRYVIISYGGGGLPGGDGYN